MDVVHERLDIKPLALVHLCRHDGASHYVQLAVDAFQQLDDTFLVGQCELQSL